MNEYGDSVQATNVEGDHKGGQARHDKADTLQPVSVGKCAS